MVAICLSSNFAPHFDFRANLLYRFRDVLGTINKAVLCIMQCVTPISGQSGCGSIPVSPRFDTSRIMLLVPKKCERKSEPGREVIDLHLHPSPSLEFRHMVLVANVCIELMNKKANDSFMYEVS